MDKMSTLYQSGTSMLTMVFHAHGQLCASHPWEVIVFTLTGTICLLSMNSLRGERRICGWNYECDLGTDENSYGSYEVLVFLTVTKCLAVIYIYMQFRKLKLHGSKYLLGISGLFTLFSSFAFTSAMVNLAGDDLSELNQAFPFFLLLVDLCKASTLAKFALHSGSQAELKDNIAKGMATLGPTITLDAFVELLVISIGTLSGVHHLETMCALGCLSVVINYLAFMTFYPACLFLILELSRGLSSGSLSLQVQKAASKMIEEEQKRLRPNPVTQRVKIIMSAGLVLVHAHSRLVTQISDDQLGQNNATFQKVSPTISLLKFYFLRSFTGIDVAIVLVLTFFLIVKYVFFEDDDVALQLSNDVQVIQNTKQSQTSISGDIMNEMPQSTNIKHEIKHTVTIQRRPRFSIGDFDRSEDTDEALTLEKTTQTGDINQDSYSTILTAIQHPRSLDECKQILLEDDGPSSLSDEEILTLVRAKTIPAYKIEGVLGDHLRGVSIRRKLICDNLPTDDAMEKLPYKHYDYKYVDGACCENVIGYMPLPVGVAGPLLLDGKKYMVPMATTEGTLVASTNRGCRAISLGGGVHCSVTGDGMTRGPVLRLPRVIDATRVKVWIDVPENYKVIESIFNRTSRFVKLLSIKVTQAGRNLYLRFLAKTGDAMGMNMVSKGTEASVTLLTEVFPDIEMLSLSGNYCVDKKASAINWVEGRGKSVVCDAVIPSHIVKTVLKTDVKFLVDVNINKNLIGSAMAGSIGGFNAHAANVVTAIFLATGQDPAQNIASSYCITMMETTGIDNDDLLISVTMPCLEVGTVGGGTVLPPQAACLKMLGVCGSSDNNPGENATELARVICATVLAGELSLMSALAAGHLVRSHMRHNRSTNSVPSLNKYHKVKPERHLLQQAIVNQHKMMEHDTQLSSEQSETMINNSCSANNLPANESNNRDKTGCS